MTAEGATFCIPVRNAFLKNSDLCFFATTGAVNVAFFPILGFSNWTSTTSDGWIYNPLYNREWNSILD